MYTVLVLAMSLLFSQVSYAEHTTVLQEPSHRLCPRDIVCDTPCLYGSDLDKRGCPTCNCQPAPEEAILPCPIPMCAHRCHYGYTKNANGCETCDCAEGAREMTGGLEDVGCPKFRCELDHCQFGLERDSLGCHLCRCAVDPCINKECNKTTEICQLEKDDPGCFGMLCDTTAVCSVKSLCHHHRNLHELGGHLAPDKDEMLAAMGLLTPRNRPVNYLPQCADDGRFEPRQCDHAGKYCWCVNDRGEEIDDTRIRMNNIPVGPACDRVDASAVQMKFKIMHELQSLENEVDKLKDALETHISQWFTVQVQYVTVTEIIIDPASSRILIVETIVMYDGVTDLPTAALHVHERMHHNQCDIPYREMSLRPDPASIHMSHKYDQPRLPEHGLREGPEHNWTTFCRTHQTAVIVGCAGGSMILMAVAAVIIHAAHRKREFAQFNHRKMTSNYDKNLAYAGDTIGQTGLMDDKVAIINHTDKGVDAVDNVA